MVCLKKDVFSIITLTHIVCTRASSLERFLPRRFCLCLKATTFLKSTKPDMTAPLLVLLVTTLRTRTSDYLIKLDCSNLETTACTSFDYISMYSFCHLTVSTTASSCRLLVLIIFASLDISASKVTRVLTNR